ncbi:MAG: ABC transporter substrate-binding protein [Proteobacteria bacterium]|nr:ABC transporter substrate-binding protein [Pseudomonadota bacterium]
MLRFRVAVIAMALTLFAGAEARAGKCEAESFVLSAGNAFFAAARSGSAQAFSSAASRYADLRNIALVALGQHRKKLPKAREAEYVQLAQAYMGRFMAGHSARMSGSNLEIVDCAVSGKALVVKAKSSTGKSLAFRVSKGSGGYRVQDVSVSSFWLASQLRGKFVRVINSGGGDIDALFAFLRSGKVPGKG